MDEKEALDKLTELDEEIIKLKLQDKSDSRVIFGYSIKPLKTDLWLVDLFVTPKPGFNLDDVKKVIYVLHPTFHPNKIAKISSKDSFHLQLQSWGDFHAMTVVVFKDPNLKPAQLIRWLPIGVPSEPQSI